MRAAKKDKVTRELSDKQKNRNRTLKLIVASAVVALIVYVALLIVQNNILNREETIRVYTIKESIADGVKITQDNIKTYLTLQERTVKSLPVGYIKEDETEKVIGKFTNRDFVKNEVLIDSALSNRESILSQIENPIETSLAVSGISNAVGGILREGDIINIYSVYSTRDEVKSDKIMLKAYITKVFNGSGEEISTEDKTTPATVINLIISEDKEVDFNTAIFNGNLRISKVIYNETED